MAVPPTDDDDSTHITDAVIAYRLMRYVLLDRITALEPPERARGVKCVTLSDDVFADHLPGHPVMPGALTLESLA
jgi:3-hydroxymyristoyl/3-hydroxydecanoyl-(acyl carrier protein) dehydratase